ncbi:unnamed protein product [Clavelina lepadiformis]|uniref:G-protein coupled receptors family 1 profile domain-containing protein n=1 Tax=Clavelina lepadiformis TaxID=159417 RepID=A0ABP0GVB4_CLALP
MASSFLDEDYTGLEIYSTTPMPSINTTAFDYNESCQYYKENLTFTQTYLARVVASCVLFLLSSCGNIFVLWCLLSRRRRSHVHVITLHLTLADLAYTFFSIPTDTIWTITVAWVAGDVMCKICQILKQFGMYISSFMVVVIAFDRMFSLLFPMAPLSQQRTRTKILLGVAWTLSFSCAVPAGVLFAVTEKVFCLDEPIFKQCIDYAYVHQDKLKPYYFFTMCISFIIPMIFAFVSYSLILCEISNMQRRDQRVMGRSQPPKSNNISRARKKTLILTSLVTLTFLIFWGGYYGVSIYLWFTSDQGETVPAEVSSGLFTLMYVHPAVHPLIYGLFMKDVRRNFGLMVGKLLSCVSCGRISSSHTESSTKMGRTDFCPCVRQQFNNRSDPSTYGRHLRAMSNPVLSTGKISKLSEFSVVHSEPIPKDNAKNVFTENLLNVSKDDAEIKRSNGDVIKNSDVKTYKNSYVTSAFPINGGSETKLLNNNGVL